MSALDADSSVKLRAVLQIPKGDAKLFWAASIKGSWVPVYGAEVKLKPGERAVATRLTRKQRRDVCELVGVSEKRFHNAVTGWVKLRLAHLCGKGVVTLFISPLGGDAAICPSCRGSLASSPATGTDLPAVREGPLPESLPLPAQMSEMR